MYDDLSFENSGSLNMNKEDYESPFLDSLLALDSLQPQKEQHTEENKEACTPEWEDPF